MDSTILKQVLTWVVSGGGAMILTFLLMEKIPALSRLTTEYKRYASLAIAAFLAMGTFCVMSVPLKYYPEPTTIQEWIETLFAVAFVAVGGSQAIHGRAKLHS